LSISEERYMGFLISDAARLQRTLFSRRVCDLGFTRMQWLVLRRLGERPGASQSELAKMLEVEKAGAGRLIDKLEEKGWLERRLHASDRRINRIYLTNLGRKNLDRIGPIAEAMVEEELSGLSRKQREELTYLLLNVKQRLQDMSIENDLIESVSFESEYV